MATADVRGSGRIAVVLRHGERLDEADKVRWRRLRGEGWPADDPPLTDLGRRQSRTAGACLKRMLDVEAGRGVTHRVAVLCSPTARTLDTAIELCGELQVSRVVPHYALNCCAAAKSSGVESGTTEQQGGAPQCSHPSVCVACWPPAGDIAVIDARNRKDGGFVETARELLVCAEPQADVLVLVTHREGIWELQQAVGMEVGMGYCGYLAVALGPGDSLRPHPSWASYHGSDRNGGQFLPGRLRRGSSHASSAVFICKAARSQEGGVARLWVTPGARGVWVEGGGVASGDVVELLSEPVHSEGDEGMFVLVRCASGLEGWTKARNLQLLRDQADCADGGEGQRWEEMRRGVGPARP